MAFDLFVSHSRRDDLDGRITQFIERLNREFETIHGRALKVFFDTGAVESWDEWRERVLPALRESRLFLAYLSTSYLESDHCEWDLNEYLKREIAQGLAGDGIVVIDAIDWTRWPKTRSSEPFAQRFRELTRRRSFDLRDEKPESLHQLASQIAHLIRLIERSEDSLGNIDPFNPHFTGRSTEFQRIRETLADKGICVVSGPSGVGKTAIAVEYAHAFAGEYAGGRWQVSCQGEKDLLNVFESPQLQYLHKRGRILDKRCLFILDDVTEPEILLQAELLPTNAVNSLHVIATTGLGEEHFSQSDRDCVLLTIQNLSEADAIQLLESFHPEQEINFIDRRKTTHRIARLVDGFPLALEAAAAAARSIPTLTLLNFMDPLWKAKSNDTSEDQGRSVTALLKLIVGDLSKAEMSALSMTSRVNGPFELSQVRWELAMDFPEFLNRYDRPGSPTSWQALLNNLFRLKLWQPTREVDDNGELRTARMHPLWQRSVQQVILVKTRSIEERRKSISPPASRPPVNIEPPASSPGHPYTNILPEPTITREQYSEVDSYRNDTIDIGSIKIKPKTQAPHPLDDNVMFTVYRRKTVASDKWYPLLAFAHLSERRPDAPLDEPDPVAEVKRQAHALLDRSIAEYKESTQDASRSIPRSGELMFKPSVPGIEFNPPSRTFKWEESVHREEFKMRATKELEGQTARGWLRVFLGPLIVAEVNLAFKVDSTAGATDIAPQLIDQARTFRKVFASYSHKDKAIVEHIEKLVRDTHLGLEYLRDVTKLRSGEVWNPALLQMIDAADVFQLFWSTNAMGSEYVRQEYEHALRRQLLDFVRPVYWEKPFPERPAEGLPPEALRRLHFEELTVSEPVRVPLPPPPLPELSPPPPPPMEWVDPPPPSSPLPPPPRAGGARYCPKCERIYLDSELSYCLDCGSTLERVETFERRESGARLAREDSVSKSMEFERYPPSEHYVPPASSPGGSWGSSDSVTSGPRSGSPLMTVYALMLVGSTLLEVVLLPLYLVLRYSGRSSGIVLSLLIGCSIVFLISWTIALIFWLRGR